MSHQIPSAPTAAASSMRRSRSSTSRSSAFRLLISSRWSSFIPFSFAKGLLDDDPGLTDIGTVLQIKHPLRALGAGIQNTKTSLPKALAGQPHVPELHPLGTLRSSLFNRISPGQGSVKSEDAPQKTSLRGSDPVPGTHAFKEFGLHALALASEAVAVGPG